ncbi:ABC transporter permease [Erysipelothrix sp. HDW6C]|uniref:ABC transporter permease n=1 Tax=Erysipelothrix sp. HDW6C TaxID=2714930 RepID=UPI00140A3C47|nr:ABC transporter permease [Erysipelothrix sp. HDW6C]QIK69006.1 ABC transporter permease [Erysipelothrix sp. HDW6C]
MRQFIRILRMDLVNLFSNPVWLFMNAGFPLLLFFIIGNLTRSHYGDTLSSFDYYAVTLLVYTAVNSAVMASNTFLENQIKSANIRIAYAPIKPKFIFETKIFATQIFIWVLMVVMALIMRFTTGANFGGIPGLLALGAISFFASCLGVMVACFMRSEETANMLVSNLIALFAILGGTFYSLEGFGSVFVMLSNLSFVKWIQTGMFQLIYDQRSSLIVTTTVVLVLLGLVMMWISRKVFKVEDYL